jgi:hypothetical protein
LITFISAPISIVSSVSFNKGILLHQVWQNRINAQACHAHTINL